MPDIPLPQNEIARLIALRKLLILDTEPEKRFDRIVQSAALELEVPMAYIALLDEKRQWFKAKLGFELDYTDRQVAICSHTIMDEHILVIPDTTKDVRTQKNPLVTGAPYVRFYAGAPLKLSSGEVVGTISIWDTRPRAWSLENNAMLSKLRDLVVVELMINRQHDSKVFS
jgi:GAF domain-containing protein